ncbi:MAG: NADH-quinone oxidoreductase subunit [Actinomycetota bacterium]|nr:NADH-quinone oxidoreductase subunit [Actinomycetota bacterium]
MSSAAAHGPWATVPGVIETRDLKGEVTVVVEIGALTEAALHLRDEEGFNFLSDITAVDYLGWGEVGVSGYIGTGTNNIAPGRNLNSPMTQGLQVVPLPKPKRFAMNYHLLSVSDRPRRLRLQTWVDEGEPVPTVIEIWPTADFHEREAFDLRGIAITGHPNMKRILLDDDWEGHPLRKDYPIGGEPVRFSEER